MNDNEYDVIIIGSGFGGSVSAMRLAQKGYKVAILEKGRRWNASNFPKSNWQITKFFWAPLLSCFGFQKITFLKGLMVFHGVGVGGGSLVYANILMKPKDEIFQKKEWPDGIDWKKELNPHYEMAGRMLGVTPNTYFDNGELALKELSRELGVSNTFHGTEVGVYFGEPNKLEKDPYFSGAGPDRVGCNFCGGCMVGCRYLSKNTLDFNYLFFAEKWGAKVFQNTEAQRITPKDDGYLIETDSPSPFFSRKKIWTTKKIIIAAGVLGSLDLLLRNRDQYKTLSKISTLLGENVRTNGESLVGATSFNSKIDFSKGIAIGAAIHPDPIIKIENVRYPSGSGAMRFFGIPLTPSGNAVTRPLKLLLTLIQRFPKVLRLFMVKDWAKSTVVLLVMQSIDQKISLILGRSLWSFWFKTLQRKGGNVPCYFPIAQQSAKILAQKIQGEPINVIGEVLAKMPATAHMLGGCAMGTNRLNGVISTSHELFEYPGIFVVDGSSIPVNLGVNPSLTITALAERFSAQWKDKNNEEARQIKFSKNPSETHFRDS